MAQLKAPNEIVTETLLQSILMDAADYQKVQNGIKQKFGLDISVAELKGMYSFYQLLTKIMKDSTQQKTM